MQEQTRRIWDAVTLTSPKQQSVFLFGFADDHPEYDQELRKADIEVTQFGLLTGLVAVGESENLKCRLYHRQHYGYTVGSIAAGLDQC